MAWMRVFMAVFVVFATTLVLLPVQLAAIAFMHPVRQRLPRWWHRVACRALGTRVHVHGRIETGRPLLLVSNHVTWQDILVMGSVADVIYIAKSEVRSWPVFGVLARLQRSVFIERERRRESGRQITDVAARLTAGEIVVLFAEGTTSDGNRVLDFKSSLFGAASSAAAAAENGTVLVQPVAIAYTRLHGMPMGRYHRPIAAWPGDIGLLPSLITVLKEGAIDVDVCFGEAVVFTAKSRRKAVAADMEAAVRTMLTGRLRAPPPPKPGTPRARATALGDVRNREQKDVSSGPQ